MANGFNFTNSLGGGNVGGQAPGPISNLISDYSKIGGIGGGFLGQLLGTQQYGTGWENQIPGMMQKYLGPYAQMGLNLMPQLQGQYSQMMNNPGQTLANLGKGFTQDPQYQQAIQAAGQSAAAGGMAGTPAAQQGAAQAANMGYQDYLRNAMGVFQGGLGGLGGLEQQGLSAGQGITQGMVDYLTSRAQQEINQAGQQQGLLGAIIGAAGHFL